MGAEMIETTERLAQYLDQCAPKTGTPVCAIDTEADSLHRYRESLCLVQFAIRGESVLIDPLAIQDISPLGSYLANATVWMHGADYDMTMLKREFGTLPPMIYDTQIGARLLGVRRFGLGDLVARYFGVELSKSSQKADWGKRPLSQKMIEYALNDVDYLLEMGDIITTALKDLARYEWFEESCIAAREKVLQRDDENREDLWRIQGSGKLPPLGLAYLRALWHWRDAEAKSWDKPTFMVAPNRVLLEWCDALLESNKIEFPRHYRPDRIKRLLSTLNDVRNLPESDWPRRPSVKRRKHDKDFERKVAELIGRREKIATELDIEGSLIAPRGVLESLVAGDAQPADLLLKWQLECMDLPQS